MTKPPKKYDRSYWFKQYFRAIGPVIRLVDKAAEDLGETRCRQKMDVHQHLEAATEEMMHWMKVNRYDSRS